MLDSMMEFSKEGMAKILEAYIANAIDLLNENKRRFERRAIAEVTRRRFFGLRKPLAVDPTPEQAVSIVKAKLNWYGYSDQSYRARRMQAHYFQDMMDKSDPESKILLSVDDYSMLISGDYSSKASWNSDQWHKKNDPNLAD